MSLHDLELKFVELKGQIENLLGLDKRTNDLEKTLNNLSNEIVNMKKDISNLDGKMKDVIDDKRRLLRVIIGAIILALLSLVLVTNK